MAYTKESITNVAKDLILDNRLSSRVGYEWLDIVGIPQRPENLRDSLYFTTHSEGVGGWDSGFDRRPNAAKIARDTGWDLVVEDERNFDGLNYLKVSSLEKFTNKLYESSRQKNEPFVVGVTASVGKTTTVAFLEHLAQEANINVVRFYSKRLTPLSVMCHYINRVNEETSLVVMEYSIYLKSHVYELAKLLPPDLAFLINIYETHINPGMFTDKKDILESKLRIKQENSLAFINNRVIEELGVKKPFGWNGFNISFPLIRNNYLPPTLRSAEIYTVGKLFTDSLGIKRQVLDKAYKSFRPKENRMVICQFENKKVFFHGETSGGARLWSWFETFDGRKPWFFVEEINFADEDPNGFKALLEKVFDSDKTFVLDTPPNRNKLPVKANFVDQSLFGEILRDKAEGYIVYHKALSAREKEFDPTTYLQLKWG